MPLGDAAAAAADIETLKELRARVADFSPYWAEQVQIQVEAAEAWRLYAAGDTSAALQRMAHDSTLWPIEFNLGTNGRGYFDDLTTLMDVVDGYPGSKAVVMFSGLTVLSAQVRTDNWFNDVAMHATSARAGIYPSFTPGLTAVGGPRVSQDLSRLANQSGGRMPYFTSDLSMSYRRAERDLSCRYSLGVYVNAINWSKELGQ